MPDTAARLDHVLAEGRRRLAEGGVAAPAAEVRKIWAALFGRVPGESVLERNRSLEPADAERLASAFERRARGEPLAHVTAMAGFRHLDLHSDCRALIPRPETEGLVEGMLARVRIGVAVDVGTGSGCIALSLADEGDFTCVVGIDRSADALQLARSNRDDLGLSVAFLQGDLATSIATGSVDALVANPPYLSAAEYSELDPAVRDWEPSMALVSGTDGLDATFALLQDGLRALRPGGWIGLELDCTRAVSVADRAMHLGWTTVSVEADLFGRDRYLFAQRSGTS